VVRDALLGRATHDWDFAVDGNAIRLARAVADELDGAFYALDRERDTGRVILPAEDGGQLELDFAALRGPDLESDLWARDFTINAMAVGPEGRLIDPTGGLADLQGRLVRAVGEEAFEKDPLRMLRAVRLIAELNLRLESRTAIWIIQRAETLAQVSAERIRDELMRILDLPAAADHVHMLDELGLLVRVIPEVEYLKEQEQSPPHRFDVWWHTLLIVEAVGAMLVTLAGGQPRLAYVDAPPHVWSDVEGALGRFRPALAAHLEAHGGAALLRLAALCHDLGKPLTCTEDEDGRLHFYGHERVGARITAQRLRELRFKRAEVKCVEDVVRGHMRPGHLARVEGPVTRRAIYRFFRDTGEAGVHIVLLSLADHVSTYGPNLESQRWARRLEVAEKLLAHYFERQQETVSPVPLVSGKDLMAELDLEEGPQIGQLLEAVREAQAAGEVRTREEALELTRRLRQE